MWRSGPRSPLRRLGVTITPKRSGVGQREGLRNKEFLELTVEGYNRGGLLVNLWGLGGFVPASRLEDLQGIKSEEEKKTD